MTHHEARELLQRNRLAVLATTSPGGRPGAALIGVAVCDDLHVVFDTLRTSRKHTNLLANPYVALVIGWDDEATFQYEGLARVTRDPRRLADYFSAFPDGRQRALSQEVVHVLIRPTWIRYSDYGGESPRIEEVALAPF